jgi:hypothetical protein
VLEIENPRDHQVFGDVRSVLRAAGIEVVSFEVKVDNQVLRGRLELTDSNGAALGQDRHLEVQDRVLQVVLARPQSNSKPPQAEAAG